MGNRKIYVPDPSLTTLLCNWCTSVKDVSEFHKRKYLPNGYDKHCKKCVNAKQKAYYHNNIVKKRTMKNESRKRCLARGVDSSFIDNLRKFNISAERYQTMLDNQLGACAVCHKTPDQNGKRLAIDHDHSCCTGNKSCGVCVRGLLCFTCNVAEGFLNGDTTTALQMASYMVKYSDIRDILLADSQNQTPFLG